MARALITGITGMVGSHLADYLLAHTDWEIYGLCRWRSPLDNIEHLLGRINQGDRLRLIYGDLRDARLDRRLRAPQPCPITCSISRRSRSHAPVSTRRWRRWTPTSPARVIYSKRCAPPRERRWIHVCSSSEVFGRVPSDKVPINEECSFHPASPYAISKAGTDLLGRFYAEAYGMRIMVTRMFTHTGPRRGDVFAESSFAKQIAMIEAGLLPPVVKVGNLNSLRTVADVRDAVRAYHMLLTVNPQAGEAYNIGGTYTCTVGDVLDTLLAKSTRRDIKVEVDPDRLRPIDADLQVPDTRKFTAHTGWAPRIQL